MKEDEYKRYMAHWEGRKLEAQIDLAYTKEQIQLLKEAYKNQD